jgi:hypothetical protein
MGSEEAIREVSDVTVAELARAAKARNSPLRHPIVGAYSRSIGITLNIDDAIVDVAGDRRCAIPKVVHIRIFLTDRAVHLPREFANTPCLLELARGHQQKHAQADDALLDRLVLTLPEELRTGLTTMALEPAPPKPPRGWG